MYEILELLQLTRTEAFSVDRINVQTSLNEIRYKGSTDLDRSARVRLVEFVECVLASAPLWNSREGNDLCHIAGEISELLSEDVEISEDQRRWLRLRAALLYELGEAPAVASTMLHEGDVSLPLLQFFRREGLFGELNGYDFDAEVLADESFTLEWGALDWDVLRAGRYIQTLGERFANPDSRVMSLVASSIALPLLATDYQALSTVIQMRLKNATCTYVKNDLLTAMQSVSFPSELWAAQTEAIESGLLNRDMRSWGMAAPTGTGKSFLTQVLIADLLLSEPNGLVLYLVPSKALVYEVSKRLTATFSQLHIRVTAITPALIDLDQEEEESISLSSVLVLTPEKADLLVRISATTFDRTRLVVVDEAHHIESGTRGVLLEMYLWRLKNLVRNDARFVFLSAVTPNIKELTGWLGTPSDTIVHSRRPTRMRVAIYRIGREGRYRKGWLDYGTAGKVTLFEKGIESSKRGQLVQLAQALGVAGPVLIVAKGQKECENLAEEMASRIGSDDELSSQEWNSDVIQRLDSRLERELYPDVPMRKLLKSRVVYHHAGLPPRVRTTVEDAIREGYVQYVFATTTLAEGVNFPFSSVVVQSLALRDPPTSGRPASFSPVTPRVFWNIAGRAGRPGTDREGQVILFEPSLGINAIDYVLGDYLNPDLRSIAPVASALGNVLKTIVSELKSGELREEWIDKLKIDERTPRRIQGTVNLIRVSLIHARATRSLTTPEDILAGTFAAEFFDDEMYREAENIVMVQDDVVRSFLSHPTAPDADIAAELGLSIQTLDDLRRYASSLEDWQIARFSDILRNGDIVQNQIEYLISPVAKRMGEMEGGFLGGFVTEIVRQWILGVPFSRLRRRQSERIEDLVSVVYSRIQYLLPWGLYAFDRLVQEEAERRSIQYSNGIRSIAYLVDAGVPGFNALRLTSADIERVDATRLASTYKARGGLELGVDVVQWVSRLTEREINEVVSGNDSRRIDYDLIGLIGELATQ